MTYICDGALCGLVGGDWAQCDEGYGPVDLREDGSFDYEYVSFGWQVLTRAQVSNPCFVGVAIPVFAQCDFVGEELPAAAHAAVRNIEAKCRSIGHQP